MDVFVNGLGAPNLAITLLRVTLGVFFMISGYHKLFNRQRHKTITDTMVADKVPFPKFDSWFVPIIEFSAGAALVVGFLTTLAAFGLFCVCFGACIWDGLKRIPGWQPLDMADYLDDVLYLPEFLYGVILLALILVGAGPFSLDNIVAHLV